MAMIEGGAFKCSRHDFETQSIEEWNDHCDDGDHYDEGHTACSMCGQRVEFLLPFHRLDAGGSKKFNVRCDQCETKSVNLKGKGKTSK